MSKKLSTIGVGSLENDTIKYIIFELKEYK